MSEMKVDKFGFWIGRKVNPNGKTKIVCDKCRDKVAYAKIKIETKETYCFKCYKNEVN